MGRNTFDVRFPPSARPYQSVLMIDAIWLSGPNGSPSTRLKREADGSGTLTSDVPLSQIR